jgi:hypothetical protein
MNTSTVAVGTGALVVGGMWANGKPLNIKIIIGIGAYAVCLSVLSAADPGMANSVGFLVFFLACGYYLADSPGQQGLVSKLFGGAAGAAPTTAAPVPVIPGGR